MRPEPQGDTQEGPQTAAQAMRVLRQLLDDGDGNAAVAFLLEFGQAHPGEFYAMMPDLFGPED